MRTVTQKFFRTIYITDIQKKFLEAKEFWLKNERENKTGEFFDSGFEYVFEVPKKIAYQSYRYDHSDNSTFL